jgi:hypothetical protein
VTGEGGTHVDSESVTVTLARANGGRRASTGAAEGSVAADWLSCHTLRTRHKEGERGAESVNGVPQWPLHPRYASL